MSRDPVVTAEINNDTDTEHAERARYNSMSQQWRWTKDTLLAGKKVYTFDCAYDLNEHIINKYHKELNPDYNFVDGYIRNDIDAALRQLVECEAGSLASEIVG